MCYRILCSGLPTHGDAAIGCGLHAPGTPSVEGVSTIDERPTNGIGWAPGRGASSAVTIPGSNIPVSASAIDFVILGTQGNKF